ncbi:MULTISPECIES: MlaD family protein [Rhodomicrobium]|uniref:ABC-type transport auxiliary lipoprotein family protein n=1 Tax=Rhodomicrobium TaxID=1068 RepID=UPI000B4B8A67|nr:MULTISPECIES: MlaD family protein [Rhodomicrobium]
MEIRARYILMGLFLIAVLAGGFGFIYWLNNSAGFGQRATYNVRFDKSVSGLFTGSSVLFNGIRVGEVTALRLSAVRPSEVDVEVAVDADTPIRSDTEVDLEYQGLTGVAAISLTGGNSGVPLVPQNGRPPLLVARVGAGQTVTTSARDALLKINGILDDNSQPFKELVGNLNNFASALSRNAAKVDGILAGLERMTGGVRGPDSDKAFDLIAATKFDSPAKPLRGQLTIPEPSAIIQVNTQNILFRPSPNESPLTPGPRWADNLTVLVQSKIVQSFENAGYIGSVSKNGDAVTGDFQLLTDIRNFQMLTGPTPLAELDFSAKIADKDGKIIDAKLFHAEAPAPSADTGPAVEALNKAFGIAATELVDWASTVLAKGAEPVEDVGEPAVSATPDADPAPAPGAAQAAPAPDAPAQQ